MLGDALASRFEFGDQTLEDKVGRHVTGHRLSDGLPVVLTVLDPQLKVGAAETHAVVEVSRSLAALRSSAVLHCLEAGRTEGGNLYVLCEGTDVPTLKTALRASGGMAPETALAAAYQIAAVLKDAADAGVTHLDLSNGAIHVETGGDLRVRVAKFGHAKLLPSYNPSRKNDPYHGVAEYMAPEVCAGRPGDASSDLYALGILMYEMVAGKPPFLSSSPSTTIKRQVYEKPLPLHLVKPGMVQMESYEQLVNRLLAKDPKTRPANAGEVLTALTTIRDEAFQGAELTVPVQRDEAVEPVSLLAEELVPAEPEPAVTGAPVGGGTQVFTGLAEAVAEAQAAKDAAQGAPAPRPAAGESRPTEAFDASFIAAALDKAKEDAEAKAGAAAGTPAEGTPTEGAEPAATEGVEPGVGAAPEEWQGTDAVTGPVPVSVFTPRDREERKESRMFWIVAAAVAVLIAIAIGVYLKGQRAELDDALSPEAGEVPAEQVPTPAPPPPRPTPRQMTPIVPPKVPAAPQEAVAPAPPPPTESPVVVRPAGPTPEEKAAALVARARSELADGRPADAKQSLETALEMDPDNADAKRLLDTAEARIRAAQRAPAPKPAPRPRRTTVSTAPATPAPAPKPAAPAMSDAERNAKVGDLIKAGRSAYNSGDYKTAISQYNQALKLDPGNALVKKLLAQAQAKSAE
jgi:serine/threonine-protein kinase